MVRIARREIENFFHPFKMASKLVKIQPRNISSVDTFKDLDSHNEKVAIKKRWRCVRCYSWMNEKQLTDMYSETYL